MTASVFALLAASLAVLPTDRLAMADRLFNRGEFADARAEYVALKGAREIAADELLYRLAECERALGDGAASRAHYGELLASFPQSRHADRSRLFRALAGTEAERRAELQALDSDRVEPSVRATALYHLGVLTGDAARLARAVQLDPKGRLAPYARFRRAAILLESKDADERRAAIGELLEIAFGDNRELAPEALYLAGARSYAENRHGEAASLLRRYLKLYPDGKMAGAVRTMCAWSYYRSGRYADALAICGDAKGDDCDYLRAALANATGDTVRARDLMTAYLEAWPRGRYRANVELALSRLEFADAEKRNDAAKILESAKRSAALSKSPADRLRLGWAFERMGDEREAMAEYLALARAEPGSNEAVEALLRKALIDIRAGRWSPAELALAEALKTQPKSAHRAELLYWRGLASCRLDHETEGAALLKEALALGLGLDQAREARLVLADRDYNEGHVEAAREEYRRLVREGATERMGAAKLLSVGRFLLEGTNAVEEAGMCAKALAALDRSEWRQAAWALLGASEERRGEFTAAIASYRKAMAEKTETEARGAAALALGRLETRAGEYDAAIATLGEAVKANARNAPARLEAYLNLARACEAKGDFANACAYATVVVTLFNDPAAAAEAERILKAHPEARK